MQIFLKIDVRGVLFVIIAHKFMLRNDEHMQKQEKTN